MKRVPNNIVDAARILSACESKEIKVEKISDDELFNSRRSR